ncbi:MAG: RHS domain-containing protein [Nitrospirae bacterium]|nr:RHS domain-containing protein [Nitrospirota bacterium]
MYRGVNRLLIPMLFILLTSVAYAGYEDLDSPPDIICQTGNRSGNSLAYGGKPISLLSGMETYAPSTDLTLGNLFPITITRSYNSRISYDSPLGYGWAINYDKRLYTYPDNSVTVRRDCGGKKRFTWMSPSGYIGQTGDTGALVQNADGTHTYTDKNGDKDTYDTRGRLLRMADAKGNSLVFTYQADTRDFLYGLLPFNIDQSTSLIVAYDYHLSKIEEKDASDNATGKYVDLHYDGGTGRLTDITDGIRTVSYGHDSIGNLTSVSGPNGNSIYGYTDPNNRRHLLTSIDEGQGAYENTYDTTGRVTKQTHGTGEIDFTYIIPYQKTTMTTLVMDSTNNLLNTRTRTVEFDTNGMAVKVTDTNGNITTYIRDNSTTWILEEGYTDIATGITTTTAYGYDAKGNVLTRTEAQGTAIEKTTTYTYHPVFNGVLTETVLSVVNPAQVRVITNTYDETNGNLLTTTEQGLLGNGTQYTYVTTYTYYPNGKLESIDGPRDGDLDKTIYTYAPTTGYLTSITQPTNLTTIYANHDSLGNPQTVTDPNGNATTYTYDENGRVASIKAGNDAETKYFYVAGGCQSCGGGANKLDYIVLPEGNVIDYDYDDMGNLRFIKDSLGNGNGIYYTYDSEGNKLTELINDASNKFLSYQYDALNRLSLIVNPDSSYTQYGYDSRGNRTSLRTPNSELTTYTYDPLNRLILASQPGTVNTIYGYDTNNNLTSVRDANNNTTVYKYDDKGRVYQVISPDTGTTIYDYDPAGNLTSKTDAKLVTTSYQYDALNRLTKIDFTSDYDINYTYDTCVNGKGRLCVMADASGTTSYEYSPKGQVTKETKVIDSHTYITQYTYDQNGNLKTMTYPSGRVITYNYTNDRAVSVLNNAATLATSINYKPFGGMSGLMYGNGIVGTIGYDNQYRITNIQTSGTMNLSYNLYDANGNIKSIQNTFEPSKNKTFDYDALDRLSTAISSGIWGSLGWTYDGVGNRQTEGSTVYTYTAGTNKLTGAGGLNFGYDNNGNTTSQAARTYIYNQNQRLIQVNDGSMTAYYTYNGNGQRVKKNVSGAITVFHYGLNGQIIAESNNSGNITAEYVYLNGQPLAKIEGTNTYYYHNDHLGTPQVMTDSAGVVKWSADYKPFGEATVTVSTITNNLRFPGQYYDAETGLNYNYMRNYNPVIGRYIEADPMGLPSGINLYAYVRNNPNRGKDPFGLAEKCISWFDNKSDWSFHAIGAPEWKFAGTTVIIEGLSGGCHWEKIQYGYRTRTVTERQLCCDTCTKKCYLKDGSTKTEYDNNYNKVIGSATTGIHWQGDATKHEWVMKCEKSDIQTIYGDI